MHTYNKRHSHKHDRLSTLHENEGTQSRAQAIENRLASTLRIEGLLPHLGGVSDGARSRDAEMLTRGCPAVTSGALRRGLLLCEFEQMVGQAANGDGKIVDEVRVYELALPHTIGIPPLDLMLSDKARRTDSALCSRVWPVLDECART
jgi:hypothetical protein